MIQVGSRAWFIGMIHFTLMIGWLEYHKNGTHQNGLFCSASLNTSSFLPSVFVPSPKTKPQCLRRVASCQWTFEYLGIFTSLSWVHISRSHTFTATLPQPSDLRNPGISWWLKVPWHREDQRALLFLWIQRGALAGELVDFFAAAEKLGEHNFSMSVCLLNLFLKP